MLCQGYVFFDGEVFVGICYGVLEYLCDVVGVGLDWFVGDVFVVDQDLFVVDWQVVGYCVEEG